MDVDRGNGWGSDTDEEMPQASGSGRSDGWGSSHSNDGAPADGAQPEPPGGLQPEPASSEGGDGPTESLTPLRDVFRGVIEQLDGVVVDSGADPLLALLDEGASLEEVYGPANDGGGEEEEEEDPTALAAVDENRLREAVGRAGEIMGGLSEARAAKLRCPKLVKLCEHSLLHKEHMMSASAEAKNLGMSRQYVRRRTLLLAAFCLVMERAFYFAIITDSIDCVTTLSKVVKVMRGGREVTKVIKGEAQGLRNTDQYDDC